MWRAEFYGKLYLRSSLFEEFCLCPVGGLVRRLADSNLLRLEALNEYAPIWGVAGCAERTRVGAQNASAIHFVSCVFWLGWPRQCRRSTGPQVYARGC